MSACLKCGMPGARDTTHVCMTAGIYGHSPAFASVPTPKRPHRCPICNGRGLVPHDFYTGYGQATTTAPEKCRACNGTGIVIA